MGILDLLYPKFCLGCGFIGAYICPRCLKKIPLLNNATCMCCGKESGNSPNHKWCLKRLNTDGVVCIFKYKGILRKIIKNTKYRLSQEILADFLKIIKPHQLENLLKYKRSFAGALIQPIPLSPKRLRSRGFNQAKLIAEHLSEVLGLKMANYMVRRIDNTPQAELESLKKRNENTRGIFGLRPGVKLRNKNIILVDDVITSGATVREAAKVLRKAGTSKIYAYALARG